MDILLDTVIVVLLLDFVSGLLHWAEDSYGRPDWPITGALITQPNILHHHKPSAFTRNSWLESAEVLIYIGIWILAVAWALGILTWQVWLFVAIGIHANELHKWNHLPEKRRPALLRYAQQLQILQTPAHHAEHHRGNKDSHYCVYTNVLNPVLDGMGFWRGLEQVVAHLFGVRKRPDPSLMTSGSDAAF